MAARTLASASPRSDGAFGPWQLDGLIAVGGLGEVWRRDARRRHRRAQAPAHAPRAQRRGAARSSRSSSGSRRRCRGIRTSSTRVEAGDVDGRARTSRSSSRPARICGGSRAAGAATRSGAAPAVLAHARDRRRRAPAPRTSTRTAGSTATSTRATWSSTARPRRVLIDLGVARPIGEPAAGARHARVHGARAGARRARGPPRPTCSRSASCCGSWSPARGCSIAARRGCRWRRSSRAERPPLADPALDAIAQAALVKDPAQRLPSARSWR